MARAPVPGRPECRQVAMLRIACRSTALMQSLFRWGKCPDKKFYDPSGNTPWNNDLWVSTRTLSLCWLSVLTWLYDRLVRATTSLENHIQDKHEQKQGTKLVRAAVIVRLV